MTGKRESKTQHETRLFLGQQVDLILYRNNVGGAMKAGQLVHYGLCVGSSDLIGIHRGGRFVAIEMKREIGGKASLAQKRFLNLINYMGGAGVICQCVEEAEVFLAALRRGDEFPMFTIAD